jgi:hypothetical protein
MKGTSTKVNQSEESSTIAAASAANTNSSVADTTARVLEKEVQYPVWVNDWDDFLLSSWP